MNKQKTAPTPKKTKEQRAEALLRYLLTIYGPKEMERLRREYYRGIN